ncbi:MAG: hypothetical protein HZA50_11565 [Planctomycetes bacterium]|nr:hypothetical protein [Planctomycetota bacterium]
MSIIPRRRNGKLIRGPTGKPAICVPHPCIDWTNPPGNWPTFVATSDPVGFSYSGTFTNFYQEGDPGAPPSPNNDSCLWLAGDLYLWCSSGGGWTAFKGNPHYTWPWGNCSEGTPEANTLCGWGAAPPPTTPFPDPIAVHEGAWPITGMSVSGGKLSGVFTLPGTGDFYCPDECTTGGYTLTITVSQA